MECFDLRQCTDGRIIQLRATETHLEWKYKTDKEWKQLLAIDTIGVTDYTKLKNLPTINNIKLTGNVSLEDLGLVPTWSGTTEEFEAVRQNLHPKTVCFITDDEGQEVQTSADDIETIN